MEARVGSLFQLYSPPLQTDEKGLRRVIGRNKISVGLVSLGEGDGVTLLSQFEHYRVRALSV